MKTSRRRVTIFVAPLVAGLALAAGSQPARGQARMALQAGTAA